MDESTKSSAPKTQAERWRDFIEVLFLALTIALFIRTFFLGFYRISTSSMAPSLRAGDFVWVSKVSYGLHIPFLNSKLFDVLPAKGDLVLFRYPDQPNEVHIKRVIGLPGDNIHIQQHQVKVNDKEFILSPIKDLQNLDFPGAEFMQFYSESNGTDIYNVMFAQSNEPSKDIGPLVVPPGEIFVMGDNRDASDDSRYWGSIPLTHVYGKMKGIWFSLDWNNSGGSKEGHIRWDRLRWDF